MNYLDAFAAHLPETKSQMNPPATLEWVEYLDAEVSKRSCVKGAKLPPSYKDFLLRWDGGLFLDDKADFGSIVIFMDGNDYDTPDLEYNHNFLDWNGKASVINKFGVADYLECQYLIIFAECSDFGVWGFDPRMTNSAGEMPVRYQVDGTWEVFTQADDFPAFLTALATRTLHFRGLGYPD